MKSNLAILIHGAGLDESKAMNALQDRGIVSDNAITPGEVSNADGQAAWDFLKEIGEKHRAKYQA